MYTPLRREQKLHRTRIESYSRGNEWNSIKKKSEWMVFVSMVADHANLERNLIVGHSRFFLIIEEMEEWYIAINPAFDRADERLGQ